MKDLSPEARELIDSHRSARSLTQADRSRMKQKVMLSVSTLGATTAVAGTAAGMSLASKVVLVALALTGMAGAGAVSVRALRSRAVSDRAPSAMLSGTASHVVAAPVPEPGAPMAPRIATVSPAPPALAALPTLELPLRPRAVSPRHTAVAPRASTMNPRPEAAKTPVPRSSVSPHRALATNPRIERAVALSASSDAEPGAHPAARDERASDSPSDRPSDSPSARAPQRPSPAPATASGALPDPEPELQAVREARDDLRAGRPASAYRRLEALDRQSRGGMLVPERSALAAIALCQSQPGPIAQARAADFLQRSPESPLATRVRAACKQTGRVDR